MEFQTLVASSGSNPLDEPLFLGSDLDPQFLTRAVFSSTDTFAIDDFTLGLIDVGPGIPEPASWAMMIMGFGLAGAAQRLSGRRRQAAVA